MHFKNQKSTQISKLKTHNWPVKQSVAGILLLALIVLVAALSSATAVPAAPVALPAAAAAPAEGLTYEEVMALAIDPQSWTMPRDTNWSNYVPNPVIDWMTEQNPASVYNPSRHAGGNEALGIPEHRNTPINGAIILVDFWDKPFLMLGEKNSDLFGWHAFAPNDSYRDYLDKIQRGDPVTKNPQRVVKDEESLLKFWEDYLNKKVTDPTDNTFNWGSNADEFWRELSYGKWNVDLTAFGVYHLEGLELEYGFSYVGANDHPPTLRRSGSRNLVSDSIAAANKDDVWLGDFDFFFICHSGYDQSGVWMEFGQVQWAEGKDVPYEYGPKAKMEELEVLFTEHPEYIVTMDGRGGYTQTTIHNEAEKIKAHIEEDTLDEYEFKFPAADWTWADNYIGQGSQPGTPGGPNTSPTRYVKWTSWAAGMTKWAGSSGYAGTTVLNSKGFSVTNIPYSQQGECNGMATYVHEFGHIVNLPDNYSSPFADTVSARTEPWDLMSRGCFAGPFGDHARWSVPGGLEADSVPVHLMFVSKKFSGFYDPGDVYELTVADLKSGGPVVNEVVARNIPMNNGGFYPQLELYKLIAPNFYKAIELSFDAANPDTATLVTTGWSNTRTRATRISFEVVERTGYDSYAPDDGVLISRLTSGSGSYQVIDSHLDDRIQTLTDYYLNGAPVGYPIAHQVHLMDGAFKAGKSFTDTGYYVGGEYRGDTRGIAGVEPAASEIISGNTVNEYYDAANKLHYYILARHDNPGKVSAFLSYSIGLLHDDGEAVTGSLTLVPKSELMPADAGRYAVQTFTLTHSADASATDIIRITFAGDLGDDAIVLNNLYALAPGESVEFDVYVKAPAGGLAAFPAADLTITATSESNAAKIAVLGASIRPTDAEIVKQFVVDDMHASEYCTENAVTMREFAPNSIITNGVVDPFFASGGTQFFPTDRTPDPVTGVAKAKIYVIAVDFTDLKGEVGVPYGVQRNVFRNQGSVYDLSNPEIIYEATFFGSDGFKKGSAAYNHYGSNGVKNIHPNKFMWGTADPAQDFKGLVQIMNEVSLGRIEIEVECLNKRLTDLNGGDSVTDKWDWFHLDGPMIGYAVQGPADCEDYRQFARLHQAAIDAAYRDIPGLDIEDIDLIYTVVPISAFGHRAGLQGGGGLDTSFSFNDQALLQRESEFRHEPGIKTKGGRIVGSGVFGIKNLWSSGNPRSAVSTSTHEFLHGLGGFDDYYYGWMPFNNGESVSSATYYRNTGESSAGSRFGGDTQDLTTWRKYRQGWVADDEIKVILPGDTEIITVRASASYAGDGGNYTDDPAIKTRMVVIPKEYRTRDTFGMLWGNGWNPKQLDYNWYDWFTNPWVGGETRAIKSFPTFYTLECRKQLGADNTMNAANQGMVVSMLANPTWETGHGGGGWKLCSGSTGMKEGAVWTDPNLGLTITVLETNVFWDRVKVEYTGKAVATVNTAYPGPAQHVYQGVLTATDNYVQAGDSFSVDFDIFTLGAAAVNDIQSPATLPTATAPYNNGVIRVATPLGVPGGIAGFTMKVEFDAANFDYVSAGAAPFTYTVNSAGVADGILFISAAGNAMIDKETILSLNFRAKAAAVAADYVVKGTVTDVALLNWRGEKLAVGDPGFDGVGTIKDSEGRVSTDPLADIYKSYVDGTVIRFYDYTAYEPAIFSKGGAVHVDNDPLYTVSGQITCDTPGAVPGSFVGVEAAIKLYDSTDKLIASGKSDWDGYYSIGGVAAGSGYYITAEKFKYFVGASAAFTVSAAAAQVDVRLKRLTFKVSGVIYGGDDSDGSGAVPLSGVEVYILNIGNAYKVLGGPCLTDAQGRYEIDATVETWNKPFAAVAVKTPAGYSTQMYAGGLQLNLGRLYGIDPSDRVYPSNTLQYGVGGGYNFLLSGDTAGRDITLTKKQEIHLRTATKSTQTFYQLRDRNGNAVGAPLQSLGNANGDDVLQNVAPGSYYIEVSRAGYVSACTMPFTVDSTRVFLRNAQSTNTLDLVAEGNAISGTVTDAISGKILPGVEIVVIPYSATRGKGVAIFSDAGGKFAYPDPGGEKDIVFSKAGYYPTTVNIASGGASLAVELQPIPNFFLTLKAAQTTLNAGDTLLIDIMLEGDRNYTQVNTSVAFDANLLQFAGYTNLSGIAAEVKKDGADKIAIRSVPSLNMLLGAPCANPVRVVTLKFTVKEDIEDATTTAISFAAGLVNPVAGATTLTGPGKPAVIQLTIDN